MMRPYLHTHITNHTHDDADPSYCPQGVTLHIRDTRSRRQLKQPGKPKKKAVMINDEATDRNKLPMFYFLNTIRFLPTS